MVSFKIYVLAYFLVAVRTIYGFNSAVHVSGLREGFERGETRGAMKIGDLIHGIVGRGLGGNAPEPGRILVGQDVFGRAVNSEAFNTRQLSSTSGGVGGLVGSLLGRGRGIIGPSNGGLKRQADGGINGVRVTPIGHREEFNAGTIIDERGQLGGQSLNAGALSGLVGSTLGRSRGLFGPLNIELKSQADRGIDRVRVTPSGRREFNAGSILNERGRLGEQGLNGGALSGSGGFGGGWKDVLLNGGLVGGVDGKSEDIGSNGKFDSISRVATMLGGNAVGSPVNSDQSSNADFSGQFDRLGRHNGRVNGLQNVGFRQGRINGGFNDGAAGRILAEGLKNGRVDTGRWALGGIVVGGSGKSFDGGRRPPTSRSTDISRGTDRRNFVRDSGSVQEFNNQSLFNQISIADIRGINEGVLGDGGAIGGQRRSGDILKVIVVNGGFGDLDTTSKDGIGSGVKDSNIETSTLSRRRLGSNEQNVGVRNRGSVVGDGGRDLKRGTVGTGVHQTRSSGRILTNLLQIVSNLVNDLESVSGPSLGDLGSDGRVGGTSSNDGNGFVEPSRDSFTSGGSPNAIGFREKFDGAAGLHDGVDVVKSRGFEALKY